MTVHAVYAVKTRVRCISRFAHGRVRGVYIGGGGGKVHNIIVCILYIIYCCAHTSLAFTYNYISIHIILHG